MHMIKFEAPFFVDVIEDTGDTEILIEHDGAVRAFYVCADGEDAPKTCRAINLLWQAVNYGMPDPAYRAEFIETYGQGAYGAEAAARFVGAMISMGIVPDDVHLTAIH